MPLPTPNKGETQSDFTSRCMGHDMMNTDFPDSKQRYAVCLRQWQKHKGTASMIIEPKHVDKTSQTD